MRAYTALLWTAFLWAVGNCVYVYLFRDGVGIYRIESAVIALVVVLLPRAIRAAGTPPPRVELTRREWTLVMALIVALWAAVYSPLLSLPFLSDDYVFLERYQHFSDIAQTGPFFRPLFAAVFWLLSNTFAGSTVLFHLLSVGLHLASASLVYGLAHRIFAANGPAMLCFAVFLLNPLQLEAVLWVSGLQELLWAFFVLAALVTYTGTPQLSLPRLVVTVALLAAALLSKETAVCYLLLIPAADVVLFRGERGKLLPLAYGLFAAEMIAYLVVRSRFVAMESTFLVDPSRYFLKQFVTLPYRFFVQPWNVTVMDVPTVFLCVSAIIAVALLFWTIAMRRTSRGVWIGAFLIFASTAPVYSYFYVREDLAAARYLYFAAGGWGFIVASWVGATVPTPRALAIAAAALAVALAVSLQLNVRPWRVAGDVVNLMRTDVVNGRPPGERLAEWSARTGVQLRFRDSIPYEYGGVGIFFNGYDEFVRSASKPSSP